MDCPPGSSVQRILQARVLECVAVISDLEGKKKTLVPTFSFFQSMPAWVRKEGVPPSGEGAPGALSQERSGWAAGGSCTWLPGSAVAVGRAPGRSQDAADVAQVGETCWRLKALI